MDDSRERRGPMQVALQEYCTEKHYRQPVYQIMSDRRGGRTAWSSTVEVQGMTFQARFWYDGQFVHNAKEDAAQSALDQLKAGAGSDGRPEMNQRDLDEEHKKMEDSKKRWEETKKRMEEMRKKAEEE